MSNAIKTDLPPKLQARCARRSRDGKTRMLDELCEDYDYERKYAIKHCRCGQAHQDQASPRERSRGAD